MTRRRRSPSATGSSSCTRAGSSRWPTRTRSPLFRTTSGWPPSWATTTSSRARSRPATAIASQWTEEPPSCGRSRRRRTRPWGSRRRAPCAPPPCRSASRAARTARTSSSASSRWSSTSAISSSYISRPGGDASSPRCPATGTPSSGGRKEAACDCPGRRRMSDSSGPEDRLPGLHVEEIAEAEQVVGGEPALGDKERAGARGRRSLTTALWTAPGAVWLLFFLFAPVLMIVLVSFWTRTVSGFEAAWTLENYEFLFDSNVYWDQLWNSFWHSLVIVAAALVLGFPVAYFLAISVTSLRYQIALFIVALAPFWTSYLIRAVAWIPMMGRQGALNTALIEGGIINAPLDILLFSDFAVTVAMLQLYILFMVAPIFFMLAQIDRSSLEAARDLGANAFKTFREVILPQSAPGIVIGSIFVFILTMGEFATVRIIGGGTVSSVGTIVQTQVASVQFPQAAASAVFLVLAMVLGVFVLLRFSNLREDL